MNSSNLDRLPRVIPPVWFLLSLVTMVVLHFYLPLAHWLVGPWKLISIPVLLAGFSLVLWSTGNFRRAGTPIRPFAKSTTLVLTGPYRFTRNPMYLSLFTILCGAALALGTASPWLIPGIFAVWIDRQYIRREELFLANLFGNSYFEFKKRVRRWL